MRSGLADKVYLLGVLLAAGCSSGASNPGDDHDPASKSIGTSGGSVTSVDGAIQVAIPAGALTADVTITVAPTSAPASGAVGTTYEIGPTGTQFAMPVAMKLSYGGLDLHGASPSSLRVATYASGSWQILPGAQIDTQAKTVSGLTTHLSPYAIVAESAGEVCAPVRGGACAGSTMSGGGSSGIGSSGGAASGGSSFACEAQTCAEATNICQAYPGASARGCSDASNGTDGYTASCCFAPTVPICFAVQFAYGCPGVSGGGAAACPTSNVSCATAVDPCRAYPGATFQGCADTTNGFHGNCCFANEAPICVKVETGCNGTASGGGGACSHPRCASSNPCSQVSGATVSSCTDTATGYEASCCFAPRTLPPSTEPPNGGGDDAGTTGPEADAGVSRDGGTSGGGGADGGEPTDPGGPDGGKPMPPEEQDGGAPPPEDGGKPMPPEEEDGGTPPPPDGGSSGGCSLKLRPPPDELSPCSVSVVCPETGLDYMVQCLPNGGPCTCLTTGTPTGTVAASCAAFDPIAMLDGCGYPVP